MEKWGKGRDPERLRDKVRAGVPGEDIKMKWLRGKAWGAAGKGVGAEDNFPLIRN